MIRVQVTVTDQPLLAQRSQCYALFLEQDFVFDNELAAIEQKLFPGLRCLLANREFIGKSGELISVPAVSHDDVRFIILVGLGAKHNELVTIEQYRRALGSAVREVNRLKADTLAIFMPEHKLFGVSPEYLAETTTTVAGMAWYHFDEFFSDTNRKTKNDLQLTVISHAHTMVAIRQGCERGHIYAHSVNTARWWVDLPPDYMTPIQLADKAKEIAQNHGYRITVFTEKDVVQMGMGGLGAVARGSDCDCQLMIMEYKSSVKDAPTIAFVGKGITFDAGGLSLKPADSMETMKEDMSGAAAVIAAMDALGKLKPKVNIVAVTPLAENLPSGKAIKPGDVVTFYNGKTAEIRNTDAEGRLILADALSYAVKHYSLDAIIDLATLTGACAYALGPFFGGLMSRDDAFVEKIYASAVRSGDRVWRLPLDDDYKPAIKSDIADIKNTGDRRYLAGAITAALFLENFVSTVPWAHLDIAGTAFNVPDISYYRQGATGFGVRLLIDLALNWPAK
jgi:leucyl aminopeptidase